MDSFNEMVFKRKVENALEHVRTILDHTRTLENPVDVHHEYSNKYQLAEYLTNISIASLHSDLEVLGINAAMFAQMKEWSQKKSVTLSVRSEETCKFLRETTREVQSDTKHVTKHVFGKSESYTVTKVTEYFWSFTATWELSFYVGVDSDKKTVVQSRTGTVELKTTIKTTPRPEHVIAAPFEVNITWLLQHMDNTGTPTFHIKREDPECKTPRRNPDVEQCLDFLRRFHAWANKVRSHIVAEYGVEVSSSEEVFDPVIPVFEDPGDSSSSTPSSIIPPIAMSAFIAEQNRSLDSKFKDLVKIYVDDTKLASLAEAKLCVVVLHMKQVCESYSQGVDSIENMLLNQLIGAIGKQVTSADFANYLTFHNRKLFREEFRPQLFCHSIRRPGYTPEGTLSIESDSNPISTIASYKIATRPMKSPINASTQISFFGDRYLHGYVAHQFGGVANHLSLAARARQFSSFILLVGRIVSADVFDPKHAIIIQNKDDLKIPLMLETIPTPKEFKDAIASLSPEQQRFCKAFRSMQLESTLFGVCVVQIKPQLEKLLKLPDDSLTKEIQLSQDLLKLFINYQIPSDLLAYDGPANADHSTQINTVKEYVKRMQDMFDRAKQAELDEARMEQEMRLAQAEHDKQRTLSPRRNSDVMRQVEAVKQLMAENIDTMLKSHDSLDMLESKSSMMNESAVMFKKQSAKPSLVSPLKNLISASKGGPTPSSAPAKSAPAPAPKVQPAQIQQAPQQQQQQQQQAPKQEAPQPQQPQQPKEVQQQQQQHQLEEEEWIEDSVVDYTKIPGELEKSFEAFDSSNALRPTIINPGNDWSLEFQKSLLSKPEKKHLNSEAQDKEKDKAFDLLDALTKSGALSIDHASLHVVIAATHCFTKNIINTIIQDNINPIEKVENSSIIVASTIHGTTPAALIAPEHLQRVTTTSPLLLTLHQE